MGQGERAGAIEALNRLNAQTQLTRTISFRPNPYQANAYERTSRSFNTSQSTENMLNSWLDGSGNAKTRVTELINTTICIRPGDDGGTKLKADKNGCLASTLLDQAVPTTINTPQLGMIYRDPKRVLVVVCNTTCGTTAKPEIIARQQVALAQFGPWRSIRLTSKAFQDKSVMASWTSAGQMTSLTYLSLIHI